METGHQIPEVFSTSNLIGDSVKNLSGEILGRMEELMIDLSSGRVAYAVLSFGGFLGVGNKLFAVPWEALKVDTENKIFILDVSRELLEDAPGFDEHDWPDTNQNGWLDHIYNYYGLPPYWQLPR